MVLCSTVALVLPYLSFKDPFRCPMCREPLFLSCVLGHPSRVWGAKPLPPTPHPQHWNLFVFSSLGMEGKGSFELKSTLPLPYPRCCSSSWREVTPCPPLS